MGWLIVGVLLIVWVLYDLFSGTVWSYRKIYRKYEPGLYWLFILIWTALAMACLVPYIVWYL